MFKHLRAEAHSEVAEQGRPAPTLTLRIKWLWLRMGYHILHVF